jgi:SPP1 gp7 family putative phage head morphogenesis protein
MARDRREPLLDRKEADENKMRLAIMRRFRRQLAGIEADIQRTKTIVTNGVFVPDDGEEVTELVRLMYNSILAGVAYNETEIGFALADGSVNRPALEYSQRYVTQWLKDLDEVSSRAVRDALSLFISQPGSSLGDVMNILRSGGFSEQRAQRIAVTEITRVYAEANQIYAQALAAQYPEFKVQKRFFTNVDDRVCPVCAPLDGKVADYNDEFEIPNPPLHVNCRCWTAITVKA